jgi:hypothetical protein
LGRHTIFSLSAGARLAGQQVTAHQQGAKGGRRGLVSAAGAADALLVNEPQDRLAPLLWSNVMIIPAPA